MSFCTAINCMDGRTQLPVIRYLQDYYAVKYVDMITETGINRVLAENNLDNLIRFVQLRLKISLQMHDSVGIAVVGHHDCAGNPVSDAEQRVHTLQAVEWVRTNYPDMPVVGLWVNADWQVASV